MQESAELQEYCRTESEKIRSVLLNLGPVKELISTKGVDMELNFYSVRCTADEIREDDLIEIVFSHIPHYVLAEKDFQESHGTGLISSFRKSYGRFIKHEGSGEFGELFLYCLLETEAQAVQIVSKMKLKTSSKMHFHGSDGVHFGFKDGKGVLYINESKLQKDYQDGTNEAFKSLRNLQEDEKKVDFEFNLIKDHLNEHIPEVAREEVLKYLNPWGTDKSQLSRRYAILVGFSESTLSEIERTDKGAALEDSVTKHLEETFERIRTYLVKKMNKETALDKYGIDFFIIPFKDIDVAKEKFLRKFQHV